MNWKSQEGLEQLAQNAITALSTEVGTDQHDMSRATMKLETLGSYLATITECKVGALRLLRKAQVDVIEQDIEGVDFSKMSKTIQNQWIEGKTADLVALYELFKGLEADYHTEIDAIRTIISFRKTEIDKGIHSYYAPDDKQKG